MTTHLLDVGCSDCGACVGERCRRALYPHAARYEARNQARLGDAERARERLMSPRGGYGAFDADPDS